MELNKWQTREADQYARDNDVSFDEAVQVLFVGAPAADPEPVAETPAGDKVKVTK